MELKAKRNGNTNKNGTLKKNSKAKKNGKKRLEEKSDDLDRFLKAHQVQLLTHLDDVNAGSTADSETLEYVDQVLVDWLNFADGRNLKSPDRKERTFWYALYELEEIAEFPVQTSIDPFKVILLKNLARVTEVLREWRELPVGFFATRPGEDLDFF